MRYSIANLKGNFYGGKFACDLMEDGCAIARVTRPYMRIRYIPSMNFKWYSHAAERRFDEFCNSLSRSEAIEALAAHLPAR